MSLHQYPEDEFDQAGAEGPVGLFREKPSRWKTVLPFLLVLIIVPVLAWGAVSLITGRGSNENASPQPTTVATQAPTGTTQASSETEAATEATTQKPTEAPTETEPAISKDVAIQILNGTRVNGLAAEAVGKLQADGYQYVSASNASGWLTEFTTVYYAPGTRAGAEAIGEILGISNFSENSTDLGNADFVVVLKGDY
ncbi:LytR C-terminal domain-containing protein [Gleimia europaea]|uniref:LytR C-terminal domain-containing protein n=1 Tax=Gleimia europaea TaxID=66228 RepID=UPI001E308FA2|nr:LytR C-terminal domain-containing protein [Gleimia europaea]